MTLPSYINFWERYTVEKLCKNNIVLFGHLNSEKSTTFQLVPVFTSIQFLNALIKFAHDDKVI